MKGKILHTTTPTARKEYTCQICGKPIGKGEKYQNIAYKEGGKLKNRKTHLGCHEKAESKKSHTDVMDLQKTFTHMEQMKMSLLRRLFGDKCGQFFQNGDRAGKAGLNGIEGLPSQSLELAAVQ